MLAVGVCGVRVNLKTTSGTPDREAFMAILRKYATRLERWQWIIQLYVSLAQIEAIADEIPRLGIPIAIDHLGYPEETEPQSLQKGYKAFLDLL